MSTNNLETSKKILPLHFLTILKAMQKWWWMPIIFIIIGIVISMFKVTVRQDLYSCQANFVYSPARFKEVISIPLLNMDSHVSLLQAPEILHKIGSELNILPEKVPGIFTLEISPQTGMVTLKAMADRPDKAHKYIMCITKIFFQAQIEKRRRFHQDYISAFRRQYQKALTKLKASEDAITDFMKKHSLIDLSQEKMSNLTQLMNLEMAEKQAEADYMSMERKLKKIQEIIATLQQQMKIKNPDKLAGASPESLKIRRDEVEQMINEMKQREMLEKKLKFHEEELRRFQELKNAPLVAENQIKAIENQIQLIMTQLRDTEGVKKLRDEMKTLNELLDTQGGIDTPASVTLRDMLIKLYDLELEQVAAKDRMSQHKKAKQQVEGYLSKLASLQEQYNNLQREKEENLIIVKKSINLMEDSEFLANLQVSDFLQVSEPLLPKAPDALTIKEKLVAVGIPFGFLMFGMTLTFLIGCVSPTVRSAGEAKVRFNKPVIGEFYDYYHANRTGLARFWPKQPVQATLPNLDTDAEEFRGMAARLTSYLSEGDKGWTIMLAEVDKNQGVENIRHISYGLAYYMNQMDFKTLLVDYLCPQGAYLDAVEARHPYDLPDPAFLDKVKGTDKKFFLCRTAGVPNEKAIHYIGLATSQEQTYLISDKWLNSFLEHAKQHYRLVLLLAPIANHEADFRICSRVSEGSIVVMASSGGRPSWEYFEAMQLLEEEKCPVVGLAVTSIIPPFAKNTTPPPAKAFVKRSGGLSKKFASV